MEKEERTAEAAGYEGEITAENLWSVIVSLQGKVFYTSKKLPFTYTVRGGELFTDRRDRSVTRSTFERALEKICSDPAIKGPKKLNVYGAPYVWAIRTPFLRLQKEKEDGGEKFEKQKSV